MTMLRFCKKLRSIVAATCLLFTFSACSPDVVVQAMGTDGATISFKTGFSKTAEQTLKSIVSAVSGEGDTDAPLFNAADITTMMRNAGLQNVTTSAPNATNIATTGSAPKISQTALAAAGILKRTEKSLTFTLGAVQFQTLYAMLDEESQAYFDLLMIPALSDETMTVAEYNELLASVFGKTFADEMTGGVFSLTLTSPDGKKATTAKATLGELLTLSAEKSWSVAW